MRGASLRPRLTWLVAPFLTFAVAGCSCEGSSSVLMRMTYQQKQLPYSETDFFPDGRAMQAPPDGTVPRERLSSLGTVSHARGPDGQYVTTIPIQLTADTMERGRKKFEIVCGTCHGLLGDGDSLVARNMALRPPPSLHLYRDRPVGNIFETVSDGFGLMPAYGNEISVEDRWAIVAYVRALQLSQNANLAMAPADVQQRLQQEAAQ